MAEGIEVKAHKLWLRGGNVLLGSIHWLSEECECCLIVIYYE
jgi:hypothetical protein